MLWFIDRTSRCFNEEAILETLFLRSKVNVKKIVWNNYFTFQDFSDADVMMHKIVLFFNITAKSSLAFIYRSSYTI